MNMKSIKEVTRQLLKEYYKEVDHEILPPQEKKVKSQLKDVRSEEYLAHNNLELALKARDRFCLFCCDRMHVEGTRIIAEKPGTFIGSYDEKAILSRAGLEEVHHVQNGMLLCMCRVYFDRLKHCIDVVDDHLCVKVVTFTEDDENKDWLWLKKKMKSDRTLCQELITDPRQPVESNGEMALYFVNNDKAIQPNRKALEFHKVASLIWSMADGSAPRDEYLSDDEVEEPPVNTAAPKRRFNIT